MTGPWGYLFVDPGVRYLAFARFDDDAVLRGVGRVSSPWDGRDAAGLPVLPAVARLTCEWPVDYPGQHAPARDLDGLRRTVEQIERLSGLPRRAATRRHPSAWKGNVPKAVCGVRILGALDATERAVLTVAGGVEDADIMDAVGLGLVTLGRLGRGCVTLR